MRGSIHRRGFLKKSSVTAAGTMIGSRLSGFGLIFSNRAQEPALLGGTPVRSKKWVKWPIWNSDAEGGLISLLRSGRWWRGAGNTIDRFEKEYARLLGAGHCLATASGTTALITAMSATGVDAGDEVIVAPFTFIATYNAVFCLKALPVFADTDAETYTLDPDTIEERITERTKAILPVHIYGLPADMDRINAIAKKHNLVVIEDACQAWLAEYRGRRCGSHGNLACFSFQNSKNLPAGEGGAITCNDEDLIDRCFAVHDHGRPHGSIRGHYSINGGNFRMQQFQAVILLSQIRRIERDADTRERNASHLTARLNEIPGIHTFKMSDGATRSAYHIYPFRYQKQAFKNLPRRKFIAALRAEGIPCGSGYYSPFRFGLIEEQLNSRGFRRLFPKERLEAYRENQGLPGTELLSEETVILTQNMLLGNTQDMDDIADAILKIRENAELLLNA